MPWKDGTGPEGMGPCGRGFGRGFGRGMGFRRFGYWSEYRKPTKEEEVEMLKADQADLKAALADIEKRLAELK